MIRYLRALAAGGGVAIAATSLGCSTASDDTQDGSGTFDGTDGATNRETGAPAEAGAPSEAGADARGAASDARAPDAFAIDSPASDATDAGDGGAAIDATETVDAGSDNVLPSGCLGDGGHSGSRWQDLYACYFGPAGVANCSLNSSCHGQSGGAAAIWTCGATSAQCYTGMVAALVPDGGASDFTTTLLYFSLRKADGSGGSMPQLPDDVTFDTEDLARIGDWVTKGAKNN